VRITRLDAVFVTDDNKAAITALSSNKTHPAISRRIDRFGDLCVKINAFMTTPRAAASFAKA